MARIPDLRPMVLEVVDRLPHASPKELVRLAATLRWIESEMYRRPPVRKAPRKARAMNPALKKKLVAYEATHPDMPIRDIGRLHGVDGGRVSEAVAGKRR